MNRPIKFRAWSKSLERMIPFEEIEISYHNITLKQTFDSQGDDILMQFTGLPDKNGKEIYEGDIVRVVYDETFGIVEVKGVIEWDEQGNWCIDFPNKGCSLAINQLYEEIEVIGNICENPELLTGERD